MSMTTIAAARDETGAGALAAAAAAVKRLGAAYITWRTEQSAIAVLSAMSERELRDVGLSRSEITGAVRRQRDGASCEL